MRRQVPLAERLITDKAYSPKFLSRFHSGYTKSGPNECWLWNRGRTKAGYGMTSLMGGEIYAHRVSWILTNGAIPKRIEICHHCDVPACVNPAHLFSGTHKENYLDASRKGRLPGNRTRGSEKPQAILNEHDVLSILAAHSVGASTRSIARIYGRGRSTIGHVVRRETWKHVHFNEQGTATR